MYDVSGQLSAEYTNDTTPPVGGGGSSYLTSDHLGSTRVVTKSDGSVKARYDYLPFGEEIPSSIGARGGVTGYGGADSTKQKFTQKERDNESGLDYFLARYYSSAQGRFTSSDPLLSSGVPDDPQTWNRYSYVLNNPLKYIDPFGLFVWGTSLGGSAADGDVSRIIREKREQIRGAIRGGNEALNSGRLDSTQKANLERALNAYGAEGTDNGVTVAVGKVDQGAAAVTKFQDSYVSLGNEPKDAQANVLVTFKEGGTVDADTVAHEGSHVADRQELVAAWVTAAMTNHNPDASALDLPENITNDNRNQERTE